MTPDIRPRLEMALRLYLAACRRLRTERDLDGLLMLLARVPDSQLRLYRFAEHLRARSADESAWTLAYLQERVAGGDDLAQHAGFGLLDLGCLGRVVPVQQLNAATAILRRRHASAGLFDEASAPAISPDDETRPRPTEPVGYRISVARRALAGALERLLFDPDVRVVRALLRNPRVTESEVLKLAASRRAGPGALEAIAQDERWLSRYPVKVALANNPATPTRVVLGLLPYLLRQDLRELSEVSGHEAVRKQAAALLARRSG